MKREFIVNAGTVASMQVLFQRPDSVLVEGRVRLEVDGGMRILESGVNQPHPGITTVTEAKSRVDPVSISDMAFDFSASLGLAKLHTTMILRTQYSLTISSQYLEPG